MRIGLVATSRSGSTYFRRYLCNTFGLYDSASWLKKNSYKDIEETNWAHQPHILKIFPHYIPDDENIQDILKDYKNIWLYRKDVLSQFFSHITRLRTKINHVHSKDEIPDIPDKSLVATKEEFDRFNSKLNKFWDLFYADDENYLVAFENFLNDPLSTLVNIQEKFDLEINNNIKTQLTVKLNIDYEKKFINFAEIEEWFAE